MMLDPRDLEPELILAIARGAVGEHFGGTLMQISERPWLYVPAATFVSIHHHVRRDVVHHVGHDVGHHARRDVGHHARRDDVHHVRRDDAHHVRRDDAHHVRRDDAHARRDDGGRAEQLHGCIGSVEPRRSLVDDLRHNAVLAAFHDPRTRALRSDEFDLVRFSVSILGPHRPLRFTDEADARSQLRPRVDGVILSWHGHRGLFLPKVWESLPEPAAFLDNLKRKAGLSVDFWAPDIELERFEVLEFDEPYDRAAKIAQGWHH
jgi:AmmeMemoRadiSam system protein A